VSVIVWFTCNGCGERRWFEFVPPIGPDGWLAVRRDTWENAVHLCPRCQSDRQLPDALLRAVEAAVVDEERRAA
jgi:hypothetical protein